MNEQEILILLIALILTGAVSGLVAGLLGVGGGLIMVPILFHVLIALGYDETAIHVAIATSLAVIISTSLRSTMSHHRKGAVDIAILRQWLVWLFVGALFGAALAGAMSGQALTAFFGGAALLVSLLFLRRDRAMAIRDSLPAGPARAIIGGAIGMVSALMGIGGGVFGVPLMTMCGVPIHRAVGTSAAFGAIIAFPSMLGYVAGGWSIHARPPLCLGYVSIPGWLAMAVAAALLAPVGAGLAHKTRPERLRMIFGIALAINGAHMLIKVMA